jgi:2-polyprenyl-6-methoxyphenol hydroxylase-like FAD-dependent oxidoreductase
MLPGELSHAGKGLSMADSSMSDVLIVGAGPVGLTLACDLARRRVAFRIIDQLPEYPVGTRARGVRARTQEVFEDLGVLAPLSSHAEPKLPMRFYDGEGRVVREAILYDAPPVPGAPYPGSLIVSQQHTETVLRGQLQSHGIAVELGREMTDLSQDPDSVVASVQHAGHKDQIRARYLVGCDGGNSTVRKSAGITFMGQTWERQRMLFGNMSVSGLDPSFGHAWAHQPGGLLTLLPMPHSGTWFFSAPLQPDEDGQPPSASVETFKHIFDERVGLPGIRFYNPVYLSVYQVNIRMVDRYREGRVFLAGDAAHVHTPAGGQGMNTGIQDAYNLGWKLSHVIRGGPDSLLETYQEERLPVARHVLASTTERGRSWTGSDAGRVSENMVGAFQGRDPFSDVSQLSINYRDSQLARDTDGATGIRAGDRAPDARCIDLSSGESTRLFEVFRGPHFTLLIFGDLPAPALDEHQRDHVRLHRIVRASNPRGTREPVLADLDGQAHELYGVTGSALILIRPDGYVGLTANNPGSVTDYLRDITGTNVGHPAASAGLS